MDLVTIRNQIADIMNLDASSNTLSTTYDRWINETYKRVSAEANWPWLVKNNIIQTQSDVTDGTISISQDDTALTFSSAPSFSATTDNGYRIQFQGSDDWFDISSHTASSTSATLSNTYKGSALSGATYILRRFWYNTISDIDRIIVLTEATKNTPFDYIDHRELKKTFPDVETSGTPYLYTVEGINSSDNWRLRFFPVPDAVINIDIWYYKLITELSADADAPIFPSKWHEILIWGVLAWYGYLFRDDPQRRNMAFDNYNKLLDSMKKSLLPVTDEITQIQPFDNRRPMGGSNRLVSPRLPGNFGYSYR